MQILTLLFTASVVSAAAYKSHDTLLLELPEPVRPCFTSPTILAPTIEKCGAGSLASADERDVICTCMVRMSTFGNMKLFGQYVDTSPAATEFRRCLKEADGSEEEQKDFERIQRAFLGECQPFMRYNLFGSDAEGQEGTGGQRKVKRWIKA